MAVGSEIFPSTMHPVAGFKLGVASAGIKKPGRRDVVLMEIAPESTVVGVFTLNAFCAAPVQLCKRHLETHSARYLLTNTGNANAGTGAQGVEDAQRCVDAVAQLCGAVSEEVLPFSTGVIGEPLPVDKIVAALDDAKADLKEDNWRLAAEGIHTTDTRLKGASVQVELGGKTVTLTGISKGSGMIQPNMATMLGYVATDAKIEQSVLQTLLRSSTDRSFNRITVDSDTSTNDSCMLVATGISGVEVSSEADLAVFAEALDRVMLDLAHAIVRDGEGATKFIAIEVEKAAAQKEALDVAFTVAHSPLVKTALFASDANWGRILAAVGRAGVEKLDIDALQIWLDNVCIVENGGRAAQYTEEAGAAVMAQEDITIRIVLNRGDVAEKVWTTDLSHDYVSINADYRS
ncbi:MAG: bifunctional glutamate N-acetyltransferase/amino-acid acetyltransferase ArgJ [Marinobacterium sp.]|nr:bifunctional glutamate N-acetyltransferase/amino-acid acetyltransferase ArgJ [Marinobacterium sp.]